MNCWLLILVILLSGRSVLSQTILSGSVIDAVQRTPISFASITTLDGRAGTASTIDGHFELSIVKLPVVLIFSHVNYGKTEITFSSPFTEKEIILQPLPVVLNAVDVSALNPYMIVASTFEKLTASAASFVANGFYRQWTKNDNIYSEPVEIFYTSKISSKGIDAAVITQGRYGYGGKIKELVRFKNFSIITEKFVFAQFADKGVLIPINKNAVDFFDFKLINVIEDKDQKITVISYEPKAANNVPGFTGQLYIDDNYNLIRFKGYIQDSRFKIMVLPDTAANNVSDERLDIDFFCDNKVDNVLLLENFKADYHCKFKFEDKTKQVHAGSFYFVYENGPKEGISWNDDTGGVNDYAAIRNSKKYDENFWTKNRVLLETPGEKELIKQFKKYKWFKQFFLN